LTQGTGFDALALLHITLREAEALSIEDGEPENKGLHPLRILLGGIDLDALVLMHMTLTKAEANGSGGAGEQGPGGGEPERKGLSGGTLLCPWLIWFCWSVQSAMIRRSLK